MAIILYGDGLMIRACKNFSEKGNTEEEKNKKRNSNSSE